MSLGERAKYYYLSEKLNCAVSLLLGASDAYNLGISKADAKLLTGFGGGIGCGSLCGALAGSIAALGKIFLPGEEMYSPEFGKICSGFVDMFKAKFSSEMCANIRPRYFSEQSRCGLVVERAGDMLQNYIESVKAGGRPG